MNNNKNGWIIFLGLVVVLLVVGFIFWPQIKNADLPDAVEEFPLTNDTNDNDMANGNDGAFNGNQNNEQDEENNDMNEMPSGTVTSVEAILSAQDKSLLVGQRADIEGAEVQSVPSDRVFYVGDSVDSSVPVLLDEDLSPDSTVEGQVNIQVGDMVSFSGLIRQVPDQADIADLLDITQGDIDSLLGNEIYIIVDGMDIEKE